MHDQNVTAHPVVRLFCELLDIPSPPGHEHAMAQRIGEELDRIGFEHTTDGAGNVLVPLAGDASERPMTVIAAHMDELGLTVRGIEPDGSLRVIPSGRVDAFKMGERPMVILGTQRLVPGVLALGSSHQAQRQTPVSWDDARVITGLSPKALEEAGVFVGTSLTVSREGRGPVFLGDASDPLIAAWTFDDRMGCVALLRLLEFIREQGIRPQRPLTIAFTMHEEGGCHGAMSLCRNLKPEVFLAVDGCPVTDTMPLSLDGRPAVWARDAKAIYDPRLIAFLVRCARAENVELQRAVYEHASSDASAAYAVGAAERVGFLGHVRQNSHGYEVARLSCFNHVLTVLKRFVIDWQ